MSSSGSLLAIRQWKKVKKSGAFRRKVKKCVTDILRSADNLDWNESLESTEKNKCIDENIEEIQRNSSCSPILAIDNSEQDIGNAEISITSEYDDDDDCEQDQTSEDLKNAEFRMNLRMWAVSHNVSQMTLRDLFKNINQRFPSILPQDPRTLLKTCQTVVVTKVGNGQYWHHGLEFCLKQVLLAMPNRPTHVSLNINMDGLPLYRSSRKEFWPILFNIHELPEIKPMIIGIYCGQGKPSEISTYLAPFVEECKIITLEGLIVDGRKVIVQIRCFICDSPARAFIKGVSNFNSKQGCLKCTTVGEYSHVSRTVYFPRAGCPKRTDEGFRAGLYGSHHKKSTPLMALPINMIEDFPVGDSLHLIDLGIMKRCLLGWRDGSFGNYKTKWCARDIAAVSNFLESCKLPSEIHRSVRGLDVLCHWKGSEYHSFLHYIGIVILKDMLPEDAYYHFLKLFCAVTICSSGFHKKFLDLARALLDDYVETYRDNYGEDYISSNVHNLTHLVDEVKIFGPLSSFSSYPFENRLYQIKNLLRNGHLPLAQIAKRFSEIMQCEKDSLITSDNCKTSYPILVNKFLGGFFRKILLRKGLMLSNSQENKWFLTYDDNIVEMQYALLINNTPMIQGKALNNIEDCFTSPINSSYLSIFKSNSLNFKDVEVYEIKSIKCKLVAVEYKNMYFFIPLTHTL